VTISAKLQLGDVTLVAADCAAPELAARALELCLERCDFADAVLFSDKPVTGSFRHHAIAPLSSVADYSRFCLRDLPTLSDTPFVLVVQWDGYVIAPEEWTSSFRKYDYIGAVIHNPLVGAYVGNGGFSLRSRKLQKALLSLPLAGDMQEDEVISRVFRAQLEKSGIRFAPLKLAERFSYEVRHTGQPTFGFHGAPNLWRHESDKDVIDICRRMRSSWRMSFHFFGLMKNCLTFERIALAESLYAMVREERSAATLRAMMAPTLPREFVGETLAQLETRYGGS
jgi:hypothetical protein